MLPKVNLVHTMPGKNRKCFPSTLATPIKGWFTLATESEAESESEAQGALRSSVNQKAESEAQ